MTQAGHRVANPGRHTQTSLFGAVVTMHPHTGKLAPNGGSRVTAEASNRDAVSRALPSMRDLIAADYALPADNKVAAARCTQRPFLLAFCLLISQCTLIRLAVLTACWQSVTMGAAV
jgi:hypothetical protein